MNLLFRDPHSYKAETFDQAVVKLEKLIEQSSNPAADWAENIISATVNLKEEYQEQFIEYQEQYCASSVQITCLLNPMTSGQ